MTDKEKEFIIHMLNMSEQVLTMALDAIERDPDNISRRADCFKMIRSTAADLRIMAGFDSLKVTL